METAADKQQVLPVTPLRKHLNDIVLVGLVALMAAAALWGEYERLPVDRKYLLIGFFGVVMLSLLTHLKYALGFFVILLVVGANIPSNLSGSLGINHIALTITLAALILTVMLNRLVFKLPTGVSKTDEEQNLADHGATALFGAVNGRNLTVIRTLLGFGIDPDIRAKGGETPLMLAVSKNYLEGVMVFIQKGADVNAKNDEGFTPLSVANIKNFATVASMLQEHGAR